MVEHVHHSPDFFAVFCEHPPCAASGPDEPTEAEAVAVWNEVSSLRRERDAALARVRELTDALQPFAERCKTYDSEPRYPDDAPLELEHGAGSLLVRDLRQAFKASDPDHAEGGNDE